jgi:hypothetical protein
MLSLLDEREILLPTKDKLLNGTRRFSGNTKISGGLVPEAPHSVCVAMTREESAE